MDGLLVEVRADDRTTAATAAAAVGATSVAVENLTPFGDDGGRVDIAGTVYDYTGTDESTVNADGEGGALLLATGLTVAVAVDDPVSVLIGGAIAVDVVAVVNPGEDDAEGLPIEVPLDTREERVAWPVKVYDPPVPVTVSDDQQTIIAAPGVMPDVHLYGSTITGGTIETGELGDPSRLLMYDNGGYGYLDWQNASGGLQSRIWSVPSQLEIDGPGSNMIGLSSDGRVVLQATAGPTTPALIDLEADTVIVERDLSVYGQLAFMVGRAFTGVDFGNATKTSDVNGDITINHSLGSNPAVVLALPGSAHTFRLSAKDASSFTLRCRNATTGAVIGAGETVIAYWLAIAS